MRQIFIEVKIGGKELAKVLYYYGLIPDVNLNEYKIVCPFHEDVNPSMMVDLVEGNFYCYGCGKTGNALTFIKYLKHLDDIHALKVLVKIMRSKKCKHIKISVKHHRERKDNEQALIEATDYYYGLKTTNWYGDEEETILARTYMKKRGFSTSTLKHCLAKVNYNSSYGIIFPMLDNGIFKGWVCRTMIKEVEKKRKYLYNEGFSRATTLVGNYKGPDIVYIVEGYMDRLKFKQFGCKRVIAILGWKITDEQIHKLKAEGITTVISALDNDECGRKGTKYLKSFFNVIRFSYLKGVKDPGEMTKDLYEKMNNKTLEKVKSSKKNVRAQ